MKEISHTPPVGETVTNVWNRGREGADEDAEAAEAAPESTVAAND